MGTSLRAVAAVWSETLVLLTMIFFQAPSDLRDAGSAGTDETARTEGLRSTNSCCVGTLASSSPTSAVGIPPVFTLAGRGERNGGGSPGDAWTDEVRKLLPRSVLDWVRRLESGLGLLRNKSDILSRRRVRCCAASSFEVPLAESVPGCDPAD
ncbi:uncharacterized protein EI90DRAFT_3089735 [Cantharellus anzutake]|uniref:uncharacterized protein n=1 Tax=Cantharellus anzutake TaxID=1750568 RepID=UPI0019033C22|nr:uncharacterized protein EI90DRAFT_3089735 [Cantharellus anzutake]KAF8314628.1 hypothetical protein EI90DRAFT_3089735 [Cantharellus anzutake]